MPSIETWDYVARMRRRHLLAGGLGAAGVLATAEPAAARSGVRTGFDRLVESRWAALEGQRVGVISNPTGVDRRYRHLVDLMHATTPLDPSAAVLVAGEPEERARAERARAGVRLPPMLLDQLRAICDTHGAPFLLRDATDGAAS